ncbi:MAG: FtsQ-type POTRA domain-containing protein [Verrucomicrobiota bacterium]|nr:FtsQ-type POTRA domain-containing protein [Limisphaera sp.]MDW8381691.1 FtsQ-type POTRA domain-containing protein [Verrucomicrobiota bacterium]
MRNRRLGRDRLLSVRMRAEAARSARMRLAARLSALMAACGVGALLFWYGGAWLQNRLFYENPRFQLRRVEVYTDGVLSVDQLRRWAGVQPGMNLLALDLSQVKRGLELVPYVAGVWVERVFPDTLRIHVRERRPLAIVQVPLPLPGGGVDFVQYGIDGEGVVVPPMDPRLVGMGPPPEPTLPLLRGVGLHEVQPGRKLEHGSITAALGWLKALQRSPMAGLVEIRELTVGDGVLEVVTADDARITFGLRDFERQLLRWREIYEAGLRHQRCIETLDLAVGNNIPVRWRGGETNGIPPAPGRAQRG